MFLFLTLLGKYTYKRFVYILVLSTFMFLLSSCNVGGGVDTGVVVKVSASTGSTTFIASDIVNIYDKNENDICGDSGDKLVIPEEESIDILFKAKKINPSLPDSEIRVERAILEYYPTKDSYPDIPPLTIYVGTTFTDSATITIPVIDNEVKEYFLTHGYNKAEYYVKITFTVIEVDYDKELTVDTGFNLDLSNRLVDENECIP